MSNNTISVKNLPNGVDVQSLGQTISAIQADPSIAQFKFRNSNKWINGPLNESTIEEFHGAKQEHGKGTRKFVLQNDEPPLLLGEDRAANPAEYLLHALAGCMTTSIVYHAAARGIKLEKVESIIDGDIDLRGLLGLDPNVRAGFQNIRVRFDIKAGPNTSADELKSLAEMSPVFNTVNAPVPINIDINLA